MTYAFWGLAGKWEFVLRTGIRDNHKRGNVGDFLRKHIKSGSKLSFVSAYFTIYAYHKLKDDLDSIEQLRFLFGEPSFIRSLDPEKNDTKSFNIEDSKLQLANRLEQKQVAKACAAWIQHKVDVRSVKRPGFLHGKMYHIDNAGVQEALLGSSNFTVSGLGLGNGTQNNIELNLEVDSRRDRKDLVKWFDELWDDPDIVLDVKEADLFDKNWHEIIQPGVVFCLRHRNPPEKDSSSRVNPLGAYYLLYIRDDGTVRFNFTNAKNTLSMLQKICVGKTQPYKELRDFFDQETSNGKDMQAYNQLLAKAVKSITSAFKKRMVAGLQAGRNFVLPDISQQVKTEDDFELITWVVVK